MYSSYRLSPLQAQQALESYYARRNATVGKVSLLAIGLVAGLGSLSVFTGRLSWLASSGAAATGLIGHQALRHKHRDSSAEAHRIRGGLWNWLADQPRPDHEACLVGEDHQFSPLIRSWARAFLEQREPLLKAMANDVLSPRPVRARDARPAVEIDEHAQGF